HRDRRHRPRRANSGGREVADQISSHRNLVPVATATARRMARSLARTRAPAIEAKNYAADLPHSARDARSAPSRIDLSLSHTTGAITHSRAVKVPKPQSAPAITRSRSPTAATASSMRRATTRGCSTKLLVESTTPGISVIDAGSLCFLNASYSCAWRGLENSIDSAPTLAW